MSTVRMMKFRSDAQRKAVFARFSNSFAKKKFYHGSAGFRGRVIGADGLVPPSKIDMPSSKDEMRGPEFDDYVFLTTDKDLAKTHAERRARFWEDTEYGPIVWQVELDESEVVPDTFDPVRYPDSFKYKGVIPSEKLRKVKLSKDPKYAVSDASARYLFLNALEKNNIDPNSVSDDVKEIMIESLQKDFDNEDGETDLIDDADSAVSQMISIFDRVKNGIHYQGEDKEKVEMFGRLDLKPLIAKESDLITETDFNK